MSEMRTNELELCQYCVLKIDTSLYQCKILTVTFATLSTLYFIPIYLHSNTKAIFVTLYKFRTIIIVVIIISIMSAWNESDACQAVATHTKSTTAAAEPNGGTKNLHWLLYSILIVASVPFGVCCSSASNIFLHIYTQSSSSFAIKAPLK